MAFDSRGSRVVGHCKISKNCKTTQLPLLTSHLFVAATSHGGGFSESVLTSLMSVKSPRNLNWAGILGKSLP